MLLFRARPLRVDLAKRPWGRLLAQLQLQAPLEASFQAAGRLSSDAQLLTQDDARQVVVPTREARVAMVRCRTLQLQLVRPR